jgi:PEP-CTERM motif-containing protein
MRLGPILALTFGLAIAGGAHASIFVVDAHNNSSTGGSGLASISLAAGDLFTVTSSTDDTWAIGELPRTSDGNGLVATRFASATDDSGQPVGTLITALFPLWTEHSLSAPYASLVGEIGGVFQELGANFSGPAWGTGTLNLYAWDENNGDNFGTISFDISRGGGNGVPEPAAWTLMLTGFGAAGALLRRRRTAILA